MKISKTLLVGALVGVVFGFILVVVGAEVMRSHLGGIFAHPLLLLLGLFVGFVIHIIVHEAGHLVAGLLSGYRFISFSIGKTVFIREEGKLHRKKFGIAGAGGQCLMSPPDMKDDKFPLVFYNLGGGLANILLAALLLPFVIGRSGYGVALLWGGILGGILLGLLNLIPLNLEGITNDGANIVSCLKYPQSRKALWIQLRFTGLLTQGIRPKDMPPEWFENIQEPICSLTGALPHFYSSVLLDKGAIDAARDNAKKFLETPGKMVGIHQNELHCDLLFTELVGECREDEIKKLYTESVQTHIKAHGAHLSNKRRMYAYTLLWEKDAPKAKKILADFEAACLHTPFKGEIPGERALVELVIGQV